MEMCDLCAVIEKETTRGVLATVIEVEGHAYRKAGVSMLLLEDGRMFGHISPGCLESDLQCYVPQVLEQERSRIVEYDMRPTDDLMWGENIGCGGLLIILLEPIHDALRRVLAQLNNFFRSGTAAVLKRTVSSDGAAVNYFVHVQEETSDAQVVVNLKHSVPKAKTVADSYGYSSYTFLYSPKPRLILLGAGDDSIPVAALSMQAGFRVVVADWREALCQADRFPGADCVTGYPAQLVQQLAIGPADYVILMSHQFQREREFLELIQGIPCAYLGIMGSSERTSRLMDGLEPNPALHSPVGLPIGAQGPAEIAISIAAELIAMKRARSASLQCGTSFSQAV